MAHHLERPRAEAFYNQHSDQLKAGQPIDVHVNKLRNFTNGARSGGPEFVVQATLIDLSTAPVKRGETAAMTAVTSY